MTSLPLEPPGTVIENMSDSGAVPPAGRLAGMRLCRRSDGRLVASARPAAYVTAALGITVMAMVRIWLDPWLGHERKFIVFLPAVMVAAWMGGAAPGGLALGLGALAGIGLYFTSWSSLHPTVGGEAYVDLLVYTVVGLTIVVLTQLRTNAFVRAEASRMQAEEARAVAEERRMEIEELNHLLQRAMTETYHRVKNNLQMVASLVATRIDEEHEMVSATELKQLERQILALAALNDLLTQQTKSGSDLTSVSSRLVLERLLTLLKASMGGRSFNQQIDDGVLTMKQATSLSLIATELVSNSLKHGMGEITVQLHVANGAACLRVLDDGPGFPDGFAPETSARTGVQLVESLARYDLGGDVCYSNRPGGGASVTISFPLDRTAGHRISTARRSLAAGA